ncbi:hypothetical protein ACFVTE_21280 [Arthrobacter sp. NPDC058097]|uniref:hypothetical protein n=1 Tax=Arthrobacter sp. NPDC058097 TaxID=3346340 RepID=UPI0036D996BE
MTYLNGATVLVTGATAGLVKATKPSPAAPPRSTRLRGTPHSRATNESCPAPLDVANPASIRAALRKQSD